MQAISMHLRFNVGKSIVQIYTNSLNTVIEMSLLSKDRAQSILEADYIKIFEMVNCLLERSHLQIYHTTEHVTFYTLLQQHVDVDTPSSSEMIRWGLLTTSVLIMIKQNYEGKPVGL